MDGHLILKRYNSQVTTSEIWNCRPKAKPIALLRLEAQRIPHNRDAPLFSDVWTLPTHLRFEIFCKQILHGDTLATRGADSSPYGYAIIEKLEADGKRIYRT
jgi:hypothetical protein